MSEAVSDGAVIEALNKVLGRLEALERKVDQLSGGASASGSPLQARLADPQIAASLGRILDRIDALESATRTIESVAQRAPVLIDGGAETLDAFMMQAEAQGVDVFDRGFRGLDVLEKASRPENLELVSELLDHAEAVRFAASAGSKAVQQLGESASLEHVSDKLGQLAGQGGKVLASPVIDKLLEGPLLDPDKLDKVVDALQRLTEVAATPAFQQLLDSGLLDGAALGTAGTAGTALVQTRAEGFEPVGLFGTLGRLGDPDVQKAMGFTFAVLKRFGAGL
ncbi:MAG: DUF1641 domain-containing protein [Deltaproteobacteria bacterium]|nr:MAG: DUF1641 domain-containing protein [Deltaproteobacteria bacterium]